MKSSGTESAGYAKAWMPLYARFSALLAPSSTGTNSLTHVSASYRASLARAAVTESISDTSTGRTSASALSGKPGRMWGSN